MARLNEDGIRRRLASLPGWELVGHEIRRTFEFDNFVKAMKFVNQVAERAEATGHHPDIDIRYNKVMLGLSTHSEGGLTSKDFDLAEVIEGLT